MGPYIIYYECLSSPIRLSVVRLYAVKIAGNANTVLLFTFCASKICSFFKRLYFHIFILYSLTLDIREIVFWLKRLIFSVQYLNFYKFWHSILNRKIIEMVLQLIFYMIMTVSFALTTHTSNKSISQRKWAQIKSLRLSDSDNKQSVIKEEFLSLFNLWLKIGPEK